MERRGGGDGRNRPISPLYDSLHSTPSSAIFRVDFVANNNNRTDASDNSPSVKPDRTVTAECYPPWSVIPALKRTFIDLKSDAAFRDLLVRVHSAISMDILPERTSSGSSGSYFIYNTRKTTSGDDKNAPIGIFKPRDEEPYAELNPRWTKWLHRNLSPCLFGRECLMPNGGWLSEAGASIVDKFFGLDVVPRTEVIELAASTFSYGFNYFLYNYCFGRNDKEIPLRMKLGSFQAFVEGFVESDNVVDVLEMLQARSDSFVATFQSELERLVVLDYIIRNTDRTSDNWLVKICWLAKDSDRIMSEKIVPEIDLMDLRPVVKIAAIDNGLAFPWKHPVDCRTYPYSWSDLPQTRIPFTTSLRKHLLVILEDPEKWQELTTRLTILYTSLDKTSRLYLPRQLSVIRGQLWNLRECLRTGGSPADLLEMPPMRVEADDEHFWRKYGGKNDKGGFVDRKERDGSKLWIREVEGRGCLKCF